MFPTKCHIDGKAGRMLFEYKTKKDGFCVVFHGHSPNFFSFFFIEVPALTSRAQSFSIRFVVICKKGCDVSVYNKF